MSTERFTVTYRIECDTYDEAKAVMWALQVEQTIEFPYEFVTDPYIKNEVTGQLVSLEPMPVGSHYRTVGVMPGRELDESHYFIGVVSYLVDTTSMEATQFLNVLFGNSSLQPGIWVVDLELCPSLVATFGGPRFGLSGLRKILGVPKRAMMQAVIKPMGTPNETLANMCAAYTRGGVDVIKDDHGITNQNFSDFKDRVACCAAQVNSVNAQNGTNTLYAANVSADGVEVLERAHYAKSVGATALMVAPSLIGFGWLHALATDSELGLPIIAHPAFGGGFSLPGISGIADYLYLGLLPRIFGADMPIFVSYGGRFTFTALQCKRISSYIRSAYQDMAPAVPSPGGGVTDARLDELVSIYDNDTMFLVGGDMFRRGPDLEANMKYFISRLEALC